MVAVMYGPAIYNAIERGDAARLRRMVGQAKRLFKAQGNLPKAIRDGEAALKKLQRSR